MIYVMSDIHGCYKEFKAMLKLIHFSDNDELYIIGDVIDRGPEPISMLLDIASRENMHLILGNHEAMMRDAILKGYTILWYRNGGEITHEQFNKLSEEERVALLDYLTELPLYKTISVNNKNYYLAHSTFKKEEDYESEEDDVIWSREYNDYKYIHKMYPKTYEKYKDYTLVAGHTPTLKILLKEFYNVILEGKQYKTHIYIGKHYINIDCGMANNNNEEMQVRLGCLRLDDMKEFYIKKKKLNI